MARHRDNPADGSEGDVPVVQADGSSALVPGILSGDGSPHDVSVGTATPSSPSAKDLWVNPNEKLNVDESIHKRTAHGWLAWTYANSDPQFIFADDYDTPIQEAMDDIDANNAVGGGRIYLPQRDFSTLGDIVPQRRTDVIGMSGGFGRTADESRISVIGDNADCFLFNTDETIQATYAGFGINMSRATRTAAGTHGVHITGGTSVHGLTMKNIFFRNGHGSIIKVDSDGNGFENYFNQLKVSLWDAGDQGGIIDWDTGGAPNHWGNIAIYPDRDQSGEFSDIFSVVSGNHYIGGLNVGGAASRLFVAPASTIVTYGICNWEPDASIKADAVASLPNGALNLLGGHGHKIRHMRIFGEADTDIPHCYRLQADNSSRLGKIYLADPVTDPRDTSGTGSDSSFTDSVVEVVDNTDEPIVYEGKGAEVLNSSGGTLAEPVSCLGDLSTVT